jgi:murein DD-endopeptidase / murein LD-carboxypeptidase
MRSTPKPCIITPLLAFILVAAPGASRVFAGTGLPHHHSGFGTEKMMPDPAPSEKNIIAKYAGLLKTDDAYVKKYISLYRFIDGWMGTPYKWGGCTRRGIDCSCFVMTIFRDVFGIRINRTTFTQFYDADVELFTNRNEYQLGDLIFFKTNIARETRNNRITHVGFYLTNGYFVQSSSSGVNIANLNRGYWKSCVVAAGRLKGNYYKKARLAVPAGEVQTQKTLELEEDSHFDPVPYPEDLEELIEEFARKLDINREKILVPEVFEFVKRNQYAPYMMRSLCDKGLSDDNCFIATLFKDVFSVEFEGGTNTQFINNNTGRLASRELRSFLDIVQVTGDDKGKPRSITGIYLYNDYFLYLDDNDVSIARLGDSSYNVQDPVFFRIKEEILKKVFENIVAKRKGMIIAVPQQKDSPQKPEKPLPAPQQEAIPGATVADTDINSLIGPPPDTNNYNPADNKKQKPAGSGTRKKTRRYKTRH